MKYNTANEKSLQRLTERQYETEATLDYVTEQLTSYLREGEEHNDLVREETISPGLTMTSVDRAKDTLKKTLQRIQELESTKRAHDALVEERHYMSAQLGVDVTADLRTALQQYVVKQDGTVTSLREEVTKLNSEVLALKETASEHATSKTETVHMLESTVNDLKNRVDSKNAIVAELRADLSSKEARLAALLAENKLLQKKLAGVDHANANALRASIEGPSMPNGVGPLSSRESPEAIGRLSPARAQAATLPKPTPRITPHNSLALQISALPPVSPKQKRKELRQQRKQQQQQLQQQRLRPDVFPSGQEQGPLSEPKTGNGIDSTYVGLQRLKGFNAETKRNFSNAGWNHWPGAAPRSDYLRKWCDG